MPIKFPRTRIQYLNIYLISKYLVRNTYANINLSREIQNIQISIRCKIQDIQISRRQSIWCKIYTLWVIFQAIFVQKINKKYQDIKIRYLSGAKYKISKCPLENLSCAIHMKYQDISGTIYPVQVIGGHKKLMVGPLPQATRTKPSFVGFTDSSQTYLLAFCNAFLPIFNN